MFVHKASASLMNTALARSFVDFGAGHSLPLVTPVCLHTIAVKAASAQGGKPRPPAELLQPSVTSGRVVCLAPFVLCSFAAPKIDAALILTWSTNL